MIIRKLDFAKVVVFISLFIINILFGGVVFADDYNGNQTNGNQSSCSGRLYQNTCGTPAGSDGGGASWHIYSTSKYSGPKISSTAVSSGAIIGNITLDTIKSNCKKDNYKFYVAYGWDVIKGSSTWNEGIYHVGPAQYGTGSIASAVYNNYNAWSFDNVKNNLSSSSMDGHRITAAAAKSLHGGTIGADVGYFCVSNSKLFKYTLKGTAISVVDNSSISSKIKDVSKTVEADSKAEITRKTHDSYVFKGWRDSKTGSYSSTSTKYTVNKLTDNKTVYAVYAPYRTLSGAALIKNGSSCSEFSSLNPSSKKVEYNTKASIEAKSHDKLTFKGWNTEKKCAGSGSSTYTVDYLKSNTTVYAVYETKDLPCKGTCNSSITIGQSKTNSNYKTNTLYVKPNSKIYLEGKYTSPTEQVAKNYFIANIPKGYKNAFSIVRCDNKDKTKCAGSDWKKIGDFTGNATTWAAKIGDTNYTTEVGTYVHAKSTTNFDSKTQKSPSSVTFKYDNNYNVVVDSAKTDSISSGIVTSYTPYNFSNSAKINLDNNASRIVYAGGKKEIPFQMIVGQKKNDLVGGSYATMVPGVKMKMTIVYKNKNGTELARENVAESQVGKLNVSNTEKGETTPGTKTVVIKDLPAGTKMCVTVSVYPASSGADNNVSTSNFSGWANSNEVCFTIAKKPSFQVWGSGIFSASATTMTVLTKYDGSGISDDGKTHVFGSWAELGIILGGVGKYPASGAATGYGSTNDAREAAKQSLSNTKPTISVLGGSNKGAYCWRTGLTFPNKNCTDDSIAFTNSTINSIVSNLGSDKSALLNRFNDEKSTDYQLEKYDGDEFNSPVTIQKGVTRIIKAENGDIEIKNNILYEDASYDSLESIPKLIVYANNINITCNVTRIDAILIANNTIDTCSDISDDNAAGRSTQLFINGAMIADIIDFRRTYGAATGLNSVIPAEIINYDSSIYLWVNQRATASASGKILTSFMRELPPRY